MTVEDELLANDVQLDLVELLKLAVVISSHLGVFLLEQRDVLEGRLFIVEEGTNT